MEHWKEGLFVSGKNGMSMKEVGFMKAQIMSWRLKGKNTNKNQETKMNAIKWVKESKAGRWEVARKVEGIKGQ
jgi:hypothetical protein